MRRSQPVANVRITVNGESVEELHPYDHDLTNWWFNLDGLPPGSHNIKIEAFDEMGNSLSWPTRLLR
jgi:hypothetical protein